MPAFVPLMCCRVFVFVFAAIAGEGEVWQWRRVFWVFRALKGRGGNSLRHSVPRTGAEASRRVSVKLAHCACGGFLCTFMLNSGLVVDCVAAGMSSGVCHQLYVIRYMSSAGRYTQLCTSAGIYHKVCNIRCISSGV